MTPQDLIAVFDTLTEAPDGVARLRELVLQLAVRGKLVPQDPDDEAANTLLLNAKKHQARLIAEKAIRRRKMTGVDDAEAPFEIPSQWTWTRIWHVAHDLGQEKPSSRFSYIDVSAIDKERGVIGGDVAVLEAAEAPSRARKKVGKGCVIYSTVRPYLRNIAVVDREFEPQPIVSTAFSVLMPYPGVSARYLYYFLRSQAFVAYVEAHQKGVAYPAINDGDFQVAPVPVPPTAEQKRIVARVDELMGLLDRLEAARSAREATRTALRDAALAALRDADTPEEVEVAWERIAGWMDDLFTDPADVDPLRQTVLQLAVRGRLVPQDPNDEPASVLLERIAEEKARLVKEKKIRNPKALPPVSEDEVPFQVPEGWAWSRVGEVTTLINGDRSKNYPNKHEYVGPEGVAFINTGHIRPGGGLSLDSMNYITRAKFDSLRSGKIEVGDLVYCLRGATIGKTAFVAPFSEGAVASSLVIIRPLADGLSRYLFRALTSPHGKCEIKKYDNGSAQPNLSAASARQFLLPVPPSEEGERIVARVDELMDLLDRLETHLDNKTTAHDAFAAAAVHHLDA